MQLRLTVPAAITLVAAAGFSSGALAADPTGVWAKEDGSAKIEVSKCGRGLCSKIVWLRNPNDRSGRPLRDARNENTSLRGRPIMGLALFSRMAPAGPNVWVGSVYNPEEGKIYNDVKVTLASTRQLVLRGCKAMLFCGEKIWTRTSAPPPAEPQVDDDEPDLIETKAKAKPEEPAREEERAEAPEQKPQVANAAATPRVEPQTPHALIAPGVVATSAKAEPLRLSGEDVPSLMMISKPAPITSTPPTDAAATEAAAAEPAPPVPSRKQAKARANPPAARKPVSAPRLATREAMAPAAVRSEAAAKPKPKVRVVQEPQERLPWERP